MQSCMWLIQKVKKNNNKGALDAITNPKGMGIFMYNSFEKGLVFNVSDKSMDYRGYHITREEAERLPMKKMAITMSPKEWRKVCDYVMLGTWFMNEEIYSSKPNPRVGLLYNRVNMCSNIRKDIIELIKQKKVSNTVTLSILEWSTLRDCIWQGMNWMPYHSHKRNFSYAKCDGMKYHDMIMVKEREAYDEMTPEEKISLTYHMAVNFV